MQNTMLLLLFFLFVEGVSGAETDETMPVMEGDSVTLRTKLTEILNDDTLLWMFGPTGSFMSQITRKANSTSFAYTDDVRFKGRLQVDQNTGSLTIRNTRIRHSGQYKLTISRGKITTKIFNVTVQRVVSGTDEVKSVSVMEGDSVALNPDETQIQGNDLVLWRFGDKGNLLAKIDLETKDNSLNVADERFRDRLQLDHQTGSLTIKNTRTTDSGLYQVMIRGSESLQQLILTVNDSGLSPGAVAGIVVVVLLVAAAVAAGVMYYLCPRTSELPKETLTVNEEDDVTLNPDTEIQPADEIQWLFGDEDTLIAEIKGETREMTPYKGTDRRFRDRLKLDIKKGSLRIRNVTAAHTGVYTLKIRRGRETLYKRFFVSVREWMLGVMEGDPVTLKPATEINKDDEILWLFRDEKELYRIAEFNGKTGQIFKNYYIAGSRFRDRLNLNKATGSLTIKNTITKDSGHYMLQMISSRGFSEQTFFVTVKDKVEEKLLNEGDSVTLNPDTEIQRDDQILWMFGDQDNLIAQIKGGTPETYDGDDGRFKDRLELDRKTGSLTITNIEAEHTGVYKLQTISSSGGYLYKKFSVLFNLRYVLVAKGEPVYLYTELTEIHGDDEIQWMFRDEKQQTLIAEIKGGTEETYDVPDGRFRDSLVLNTQTGDLTIKNSKMEHAGDYKVKIRSSKGVTNRTCVVTIRGANVINEEREQSLTKEKNDSTGKRVNESAIEMLLNGEDVDVVNEEEGSSL